VLTGEVQNGGGKQVSSGKVSGSLIPVVTVAVEGSGCKAQLEGFGVREELRTIGKSRGRKQS